MAKGKVFQDYESSRVKIKLGKIKRLNRITKALDWIKLEIGFFSIVKANVRKKVFNIYGKANQKKA